MVWDPERPRWAAELDGFAAAENAQFFLEQVLTVEDTVRLASSWSPVAVREDRDAVLDDVRDLAARSADADGPAWSSPTSPTATATAARPDRPRTSDGSGGSSTSETA